MSNYSHIIEQAKKSFSSVARLESLLEREPFNAAVQTNLIGMRRKALADKVAMESLAASSRVEVCDYRIICDDEGDYGLGRVSACLLTYQQLFTQIYDAIKNGPKGKATFGKDAEHESSLEFAFTYSGSLGVVLMAQSEMDFFDGSLDKPIDALYQIMDISDVDRVKEIAQTLGRAVVKRIHDWSKANVDGGYSADIRWKKSDGKNLGQVVDRGTLKNIVDFIESTADTKTSTIQIIGMLVGGDLQNRSFHITVSGGESYKGHLDKEALLSTEMTLGQIYDATIEISETYHFATEITKTAFKLTRLTSSV